MRGGWPRAAALRNGENSEQWGDGFARFVFLWPPIWFSVIETNLKLLTFSFTVQSSARVTGTARWAKWGGMTEFKTGFEIIILQFLGSVGIIHLWFNLEFGFPADNLSFWHAFFSIKVNESMISFSVSQTFYFGRF